MCLGISIYLSEPESFNSNWIEKCAKNGFQYIFTSLHIPEEKDERITFTKKVKNLGDIAQTVHMDVMADLSPASLERLGLEFQELPILKEWGITGVRLDYGFTAKQIAWLSHFLKVGLNASTIDADQLKELVNEGLDTSQAEACHNFYPKPFTGISKLALRERNEMFHRYGMKTMAFIPGDQKLRGPLQERLPTIEDHRNITPLESALELKELGTDKICAGDISLSDHSVQELNYLTEQVILIYVKFRKNYQSFYHTVHTNRLDAAQYVIRSATSREKNNQYKPESYTDDYFNEGDITVDNMLYGRYSGELQICLQRLPANKKVNCAGKVCKESKPLLKFIRGGRKFILLPKDC
ncbi:MupG family TIM beta-alpha barrel fold protein [Bacillus sp. NEB1478]|uniref:DUF871 domain-containing protein n=1 Tax=Bacillus sp. NEB1478 TaxID=3073816 RepID=UPI00287340E4|nr:MupG family TIM beta-alpha barrel fold protein [Bacillus sp. NEB1478]WNB93038.1 MupG family TIM beta-alpha barrel fold protein [Bacillus sp. NEB1478]